MVEIQRLLYLDESNRDTRHVLRLYNVTWLHFELLKELINKPKHITHRKLFRIYLHAISVHAPPQFECISLLSCNTERQIKDIAATTSNRKPENVSPNSLLRIQAKQKQGQLYTTLQSSYSTVAKEGRDILQYTSANTKVSREFILKRISSWQGHLKRISSYLVQSEGVWWEQTDSKYEFYDSPRKDAPLPVSPSLCETHFRSTTLNNIQERNLHMWDEITSN